MALAMLVSPTCATCGDSAPSKKCGRCQKMYYCSRGCQRSHWRTHKLTCRPSTFTAKLMVMDGAIITVKVAMDDETERLFVAVEEALREGKKRDANLPDSEEGFELYIRDQAIQRGKQISEYQLIEKVNGRNTDGKGGGSLRDYLSGDVRIAERIMSGTINSGPLVGWKASAEAVTVCGQGRMMTARRARQTRKKGQSQ